MSVDTQGMLRISELAERSGVSAATIKHYLREGLLGQEDDVLRTSRNMAYYPEQFVERIRLIKRLQEERFMPLRVIREVLGQDTDRALRLIEQRLRLPSGLELDVGIGSPRWASVDPLDSGTARVVSEGCRIIHDPEGLLARLRSAVARPRAAG